MKSRRLVLTLFLTTLLAFTFALSQAAPLRASDSYIQVMVNGVKLETEIPPAVIDGRTLLPMRDLFESLGAKVEWDPEMAMVAAVKDQQKVKIRINSKEAWINDKRIILDKAPMIIDGSTMVPLRFIAESLGQTVEWDQSSRTVYIGSRTPQTTAPIKPVETQKTLTEKTSLAYIKGKTAAFKPGAVTMRDINYVKSGTLAEDSFLACSAQGTEARFKAGTDVVFNDKGFVASGTLVSDATLAYASENSIESNVMSRGERNFAYFKGGTVVNINSQGYVTDGTLATDCQLPYSKDAAAYFKADSSIRFRADGKVATGTLAQTFNYTYVSGVMIYFLEDKPVEFYESGKVKSAYLREDQKLFLSNKSDQEVEFKKEEPIGLYESGYVSNGILRKNTSLPYSEGLYAEFKENCPISFYESAYVKSGTLSGAVSFPNAAGSSQSYGSGAIVNFNENGKAVN